MSYRASSSHSTHASKKRSSSSTSSSSGSVNCESTLSWLLAPYNRLSSAVVLSADELITNYRCTVVGRIMELVINSDHVQRSPSSAGAVATEQRKRERGEWCSAEYNKGVVLSGNSNQYAADSQLLSLTMSRSCCSSSSRHRHSH